MASGRLRPHRDLQALRKSMLSGLLSDSSTSKWLPLITFSVHAGKCTTPAHGSDSVPIPCSLLDIFIGEAWECIARNLDAHSFARFVVPGFDVE